MAGSVPVADGTVLVVRRSDHLSAGTVQVFAGRPLAAETVTVVARRVLFVAGTTYLCLEKKMFLKRI